MAPEDREDLAAMVASVGRRLVDAEEPLLAAAGLTMWEYIVLSRLARGSVTSQLALAQEIRHDKTRLIKVLDELQARGLIERSPDPADRRSHTVGITAAGRRLQATTQTAIREMEDERLAVLSATERRALLAGLSKLRAAGD